MLIAAQISVTQPYNSLLQPASDPEPDSEYRLQVGNSKFKGRVNLSGLQTPRIIFKRCIFSDLVDFSYARIDSRASFSDVDFEKELSLYKAQLPSPKIQAKSGIYIRRVRIGALRVRWEQLADPGNWMRPGMNWYETKVKSSLDEAQWDQIEQAVAEIDNSASTLNEMRFRRHWSKLFADHSAGGIPSKRGRFSKHPNGPAAPGR